MHSFQPDWLQLPGVNSYEDFGCICVSISVQIGNAFWSRFIDPFLSPPALCVSLHIGEGPGAGKQILSEWASTSRCIPGAGA